MGKNNTGHALDMIASAYKLVGGDIEILLAAAAKQNRVDLDELRGAARADKRLVALIAEHDAENAVIDEDLLDAARAALDDVKAARAALNAADLAYAAALAAIESELPMTCYFDVETFTVKARDVSASGKLSGVTVRVNNRDSERVQVGESVRGAGKGCGNPRYPFNQTVTADNSQGSFTCVFTDSAVTITGTLRDGVTEYAQTELYSDHPSKDLPDGDNGNAARWIVSDIMRRNDDMTYVAHPTATRGERDRRQYRVLAGYNVPQTFFNFQPYVVARDKAVKPEVDNKEEGGDNTEA